MTTPRDQFIEQMGLMMQAEGQPRIAGQILGYLIVEGEARTLNQMTEALKISKASASTNARMLADRGTVQRVSPVGTRQDAYKAEFDAMPQMLRAMARRFRANGERIDQIVADFPDDDTGARDRVAGFARTYRDSADFFEEWAARVSRTGCDGPSNEKNE